MATFYSLPPELIRHILSLAYPPGEEESGPGLCSTVLVHSAWREPSVSIMTEETHFDGEEDSIERFVKDGPVGFFSREVGFWRCESDQVGAVLDKAARGAIQTLKMGHPNGPFPESIFKLPSLSGVEVLWLKAAWFERYAPDGDDGVDSDVAQHSESGSDTSDNSDSDGPTMVELVTRPILFSPWPSTLRHLIVEAHDLPEQLVTTSAQTLTRLDIGSTNTCCCFYDSLLPIAPQLTNLTELVILKLATPGPFGLPHNLAPAVGAFAALEDLILPRLTPHQLEIILIHITPAQPLRFLWVTLFTLTDDPDYLDSSDWHNFDDGDKAKWYDDWVPALQRCAALPCMDGLEAWRVSVVVTELERSNEDREVGGKEFRQWKKTKPGWAEFVRAVKAKKAKLILGPL